MSAKPETKDLLKIIRDLHHIHDYHVGVRTTDASILTPRSLTITSTVGINYTTTHLINPRIRCMSASVRICWKRHVRWVWS